MTSSERRKTIKKVFFTELTEKYPGTVIEHSEGGRYQISMPKYGDFELSGGDYWDICTYYIPWATPSKEQSAYHAWVKTKEAELQEILDNIVEIYK